MSSVNHPHAHPRTTTSAGAPTTRAAARFPERPAGRGVPAWHRNPVYRAAGAEYAPEFARIFRRAQPELAQGVLLANGDK